MIGRDNVLCCKGNDLMTFIGDLKKDYKKQKRFRYPHGQKNRRFRPIFRRDIGFRWCRKRFWDGKIGSKKTREKSPIFPIKTDFS